jgi:hypothetical protein
MNFGLASSVNILSTRPQSFLCPHPAGAIDARGMSLQDSRFVLRHDTLDATPSLRPRRRGRLPGTGRRRRGADVDRHRAPTFQGPLHPIASIGGWTRGGGNELALALDLRYASREHAIFGQPEVGSGLLPGGGGTERLPRFIGRDRALEAILTSADYDATTAEGWGWITRALPDVELDDSVDTLAARLASFDRTSQASAKCRSARPSARSRLRVPDGRMHRHRQPRSRDCCTLK